MPIEGGGNSRLLSLEQSLSIFVNQDNRNPVIFDPRPNTMEQLKERDRHTHNLVLATHHLLSATNSGEKTGIALAGGLACACHATEGIIYRAHHDLDIMVPIDSGEKFLSFLAKIFSQRQKTDLSKLARNIYRLEYEEIKIDFFIYEPNYRDEAVFSGGTYPDIKLGTSFPIQTTTKPLMGKLVSVVPLQVIRLMKHYDAPIRRKGAVDLEYLNSANINYDDI